MTSVFARSGTPATSPRPALSESAPQLIIDGTERRRQRPKNPEKQALHYSGRKKTHCDKNVVIADVRQKRVGFLSHTDVGKTSDKRIADRERISYPPGTVLYKMQDFKVRASGTANPPSEKKLGWQTCLKWSMFPREFACCPQRITRIRPKKPGSFKLFRQVCRPRKKPPRGELTPAEKRTNEACSCSSQGGACTVRRETLSHCQGCMRNTKEGVSDSAMRLLLGCTTSEVQKP